MDVTRLLLDLLAVWASAEALWLGRRLRHAKTLVRHALDVRDVAVKARDDAISRVQASDAHATLLALAVAPLIEKTTWTTGAWGGRLAELQAAEKDRNLAVDKARGFLMRLPVSKDSMAVHGIGKPTDLSGKDFTARNAPEVMADVPPYPEHLRVEANLSK